MKIKDVSVALSFAKDPQRSLEKEDISHFDGFGLPGFKRVTATILQVASLLRWQCIRMNGSVDADALQECTNFLKKKVELV